MSELKWTPYRCQGYLTLDVQPTSFVISRRGEGKYTLRDTRDGKEWTFATEDEAKAYGEKEWSK